MLKLISKYFNFFFYSTYKWYLLQGEKRVAGHYTLLFMSLIFSLNIISFYVGFFLLLFKVSGKNINGTTSSIIFGIILFLNYYFFYFRKGKTKALQLFDLYHNTELKKMRKEIMIYWMSSILLMMVLLSIYFNSK